MKRVMRTELLHESRPVARLARSEHWIQPSVKVGTQHDLRCLTREVVVEPMLDAADVILVLKVRTAKMMHNLLKYRLSQGELRSHAHSHEQGVAGHLVWPRHVVLAQR